MNKFSQIYLFDHAEPLQFALSYFKDYQKFLLVNLPFELNSPDDSVSRLTKLSDIIDIDGITVIINPNNIVDGPQILSEIMYSVIELSYSPIFILCTKDDFSIFKDIDHTLITSNRRSFPIYLTSTQFFFFKRGRIHALEFSLLSPSKKNYVRILPSTPKDLLYLCPKRTYQKDIFLLDLWPMACSILIYLKYHLYRTWSELPDDRWNTHSQNPLSRKTLDRKSFAPKWQNVVCSFFWRTWRWQKQKAKSFRIRKPDFSAFFSGKKLSKLS